MEEFERRGKNDKNKGITIFVTRLQGTIEQCTDEATVLKWTLVKQIFKMWN
jgi:hypothetical protein